MASASGRGSLPSSSFGRDSELSSWLLPPSRSLSSSYVVPPHRSIVTRVISVVGLLVSLISVGMIMWLGRDRQMNKIGVEERLAKLERLADHGGELQHLDTQSAVKTTASVTLTPEIPKMPECQANYGAAKNDGVFYPDMLAVSSWIKPSGKPCASAIGSEVDISEAGNYIVICRAELTTVDHSSVVTGRRADSSVNHALKAQLALRVRVGDTKTLLKNDTGVVLHHLTYGLSTIVWLPAGARLSVLLTSFARLETRGSLRWHDVAIAWIRLGGDRPSP